MISKSLKKSLEALKEQEKISVKKEVKKELTKIKKQQKKCLHCLEEKAKYILKGTTDCYCKKCAIELFGELDYLKKI
jgi:hypothetical protein